MRPRATQHPTKTPSGAEKSPSSRNCRSCGSSGSADAVLTTRFSGERIVAPYTSQWLKEQLTNNSKPASEQAGRLDAVLAQAQID